MAEALPAREHGERHEQGEWRLVRALVEGLKEDIFYEEVLEGRMECVEGWGFVTV